MYESVWRDILGKVPPDQKDYVGFCCSVESYSHNRIAISCRSEYIEFYKDAYFGMFQRASYLALHRPIVVTLNHIPELSGDSDYTMKEIQGIIYELNPDWFFRKPFCVIYF